MQVARMAKTGKRRKRLVKDTMTEIVATEKGSALDPLLADAKDVARVLRCSDSYAYQLMESGVLPTVRLNNGRAIRVPVRALREYVAQLEGAAGA